MLHGKFQDHWTISYLNFFTIYGHGSHLGHVTWTSFPPSQRGSKWNLALIGQVVSEKMFENNGHIIIHVYSPRAGVDTTLGYIFFQ